MSNIHAHPGMRASGLSVPRITPEVLVLYRRSRPLRFTADTAVAVLVDVARKCPERASLCATAADGGVRTIFAEAGAALPSAALSAATVPTVVVVEDYRRPGELRHAGWLGTAHAAMAKAGAVLIDSTTGNADQIRLLTERAISAGAGAISLLIATNAHGWKAWDAFASEARTGGLPTVLCLPASVRGKGTIH